MEGHEWECSSCTLVNYGTDACTACDAVRPGLAAAEPARQPRHRPLRHARDNPAALVDASCDADSLNAGRTFLHEALDCCDSGWVARLLCAPRAAQAAASVDGAGRRPLFFALSRGASAATVASLLSLETAHAERAGSSPPRLLRASRAGLSPLHLFKPDTPAAVVDLLLALPDAAAAANLADSEGALPLHAAVEAGASARAVAALAALVAPGDALLATDARGRTPLHCLSSATPDDAAMVLLTMPGAAAAAAAATRHGELPLHLAAAQGCSAGALRALLALNEGAVHVFARGVTPLGLALRSHRASRDDGAAAGVLLDAHAPSLLAVASNPMEPAGFFARRELVGGQLALHMVFGALPHARLAARVEHLLGAHPKGAAAADAAGCLPLHYALRYGAPADAVRALLRAHPRAIDVRVPTAAPESPLHTACRYAPDDVVLLVIEARAAAAREKDARGWLPLHVAAAARSGGLTAPVLAALLAAHAPAAAVRVKVIKELDYLDSLPDEALRGAPTANLPLHLLLYCWGRGAAYLAAADQGIDGSAWAGVFLPLLAANRGAAAAKCSANMLPLQLASSLGAPADVLTALMDAYPASRPSPLTSLADIFTMGPSLLKLVIAQQPELAARPVPGAKGMFPLHLAARSTGIDAALFNAVLAAYPGAAREREGRGMLPLRCAVAQQTPEQLARELAPELFGAGEATFLNAFRSQPELEVGSIEKVAALLKVYPEAASDRGHDGIMPLHVAAQFEGSAGIVAALLDAFPAAATVAASSGLFEGFTPLIIALRSQNIDIAEQLLRAAPAAAAVADAAGRTPLHWFFSAGFHSCSLAKALLAAAPSVVTMRDGFGRLPLDVFRLMLHALGKTQRRKAEWALKKAECFGSADTEQIAREVLERFTSTEPSRYDYVSEGSDMDDELDSNGDAFRHQEGVTNHGTCAAIAALRRVVMPVFRGALSEADFCAGTLEEAIVRKDFAAALSIVESFPLSAKCDIDGSPPLLVIARCRPCPLELMLALIRAHPAVCATPIVVSEGFLGVGRRETYLLHQCAASAVVMEGELRESEDLDLGVNALDVVRALLAAAPQVARLLDDNDRVPAAVVLHRLPDEGKHTVPVLHLYGKAVDAGGNAALLALLLEHSLPVDARGEALADPTDAWFLALADKRATPVRAVRKVLAAHPHIATALAHACDADGRQAKGVACAESKITLTQHLRVARRYELATGAPEHASATSLVYRALDFSRAADDGGGDGALAAVSGSLFADEGGDGAAATDAAFAASLSAGAPVVLKFVRSRAQLMRELESRGYDAAGVARPRLDPTFVVPLLRAHDGDVDLEFAADAEARGLPRYALAMEAGDRSLAAVVAAERPSLDVPQLVRALARALAHVHTEGWVHGDIKPRNVVRVGGLYKLIDFDAAVRAGAPLSRTSSAYAPPEVAAARRGDGPLPCASPAHDMWALGALTAFLLTGGSLLHADEADELLHAADEAVVATWADAAREAALAPVTDPIARNFLTRLLCRDPIKRWSAAQVLEHSFVTRKPPARLEGDAFEYDVFISYRVRVDRGIAQALYEALVARGLRVFWDSKCLLTGRDWAQAFCAALAKSRAFVPLVSKGAIESWGGPPSPGRLTRDKPCDNVMLEHILAQELRWQGLVRLVIPVFIGSELGGAAAVAVSDGGPAHGDWFADGSRPEPAVDEPVESVARAVREHMDDLGLGSPHFPLVTAKGLIEELTKVQATFVRGNRAAALADVVDRIAKGVADDVALEAGPAAAGGGGAPAAAAALAARVAELEADIVALRTELTLRPERPPLGLRAAAVAPDDASAFGKTKLCCCV